MTANDLRAQGLAHLKAGRGPQAHAAFQEMERALGTTASTQQRLAKAEGLLHEGDVDAAALLFKEVLDTNPGQVDAHLGLLRIALAQGQVEDARTFSKAALLLAPSMALPWTMAGLVEESSGDTATALKHLEKGATLGPQVFMAQFNHGRLLAQLGRFVEAATPLSQATAIEPGNADAWAVLGLALQQLKSTARAIAAFTKARDLAPKDPESWCNLVDAQFDAKDYAAARATVDAGLAAVGDHPPLLEKGTACAMLQNDVDGAIDYVERELEVVPDFAQAWLNLARLHLMKGDLDKSVAAAEALLERDKDNHEALFHLGNVFDAVPDEKRAEDAYRAAIDLAPGDWRYVTNLAMLLIQGSDAAKHAEAVELLEAIAPAVPPGEHRPEYNRLLGLVRLGKKDEAKAGATALLGRIEAGHPLKPEVEKLVANLAEA